MLYIGFLVDSKYTGEPFSKYVTPKYLINVLCSFIISSSDAGKNWSYQFHFVRLLLFDIVDLSFSEPFFKYVTHKYFIVVVC